MRSEADKKGSSKRAQVPVCERVGCPSPRGEGKDKSSEGGGKGRPRGSGITEPPSTLTHLTIDRTERPLLDAIANQTEEINGTLYCQLGPEQYLVDTGADVSLHTDVPVTGYKWVDLADGSTILMGVGEKHGILGVVGFQNVVPLLSSKDLIKINLEKQALVDDESELLFPDLDIPKLTNRVCIKYMRPVNVLKEIEKVVEASDSHEKDRIREILMKGSYATHKNDVGKVDPKYTHTIRGRVPERQAQHRVDPRCKAELTNTIKELEQLGVLKKLDSALTNTPIMGVPKPDGTWRLVHNLIALNARSSTDTRTMINIAQTTRNLPNKRWKSSVDLKNGFWSVAIDEISTQKTAFTWNGVSYGWTVLPQGYKNSPNHFQGVIEDILKGLDVTVYIDDVYWTNDSENEHLELLEKVITCLAAAGLKIGLKKCEIAKHSLRYLGFNITDTGKSVSKEYLDQIAALPKPTMLCHLDHALGKCGHIMTHIPGYAVKAAPLHKIKGKALEGKNPRNRNIPIAEAEPHWSEFKDHVLRNCIDLDKRDPGKHLEVFPCLEGRDGITLNCINRKGKAPCLILSTQFSDTEQRYADQERILCGVYKFWHALKDLAQDQDIVVTTEYPALQSASKGTITGSRAMSTRWGHWSMMLTDPRVRFITTGTKCPTESKPKPLAPEVEPSWVLYTDGSQQKQDEGQAKWAFILKHKDKTVKASSGWTDGSAQTAEVTAVLEGIIAARNKHVSRLLIVTDSNYCYLGGTENLEFWEAKGYETTTGRPMAHGELWALIVEQSRGMRISWKWLKSHTEGQGPHFDGNREVDALAQKRSTDGHAKLKKLTLAVPEAWGTGGTIEIPESEADHIIKTIHVGLGHVGSQRLLKYLRAHDILIPKARQRAIAARKACGRCAMVRGTKPESVPPGQIAVPIAGEHFSADVFGPLSQATRKGHKHGLVIADNGPGKIRVYPIKTPTGAIICSCLSQFLREETGVKSLRMDNASYFTHTAVKSLLEEEGILIEYSVPYQAKTNGVAERAVRSVKEQIVKEGLESSWDEPTSLLRIHQAINLGREDKRCVSNGNTVVSSPFSLGEEVWVLRKPLAGNPSKKCEAKDTVAGILGPHRLRLENSGIVHIDQVRKTR